MSEYVVTITVQRSARGEGDTSAVVVARSEATHTSFTPGEDGLGSRVAGVVDRVSEAVASDLRENGVNV